LKASLASVLAVLLATAVPALAANDEKVCAGTKADGYTPDQIIEACSNVIANANYPGVMAGAYYNRGNSYFDKADWTDAISDYDHALKLRPNYPTAMFNRGLAKKHKGDNAGGDADIAASKTLKADN
jgi:tetratricopeptide (TPR) repeat protein